MSLLIAGDVIRPRLGWLLTPAPPRELPAVIAQGRDPDGFARLTVACADAGVATQTARLALRRIAAIMATKGGAVGDMTVGDCLQLLRATRSCAGCRRTSPN